MKTKKLNIPLSQIPELQEQTLYVISQEIKNLLQKQILTPGLSIEESKLLLTLSQTLRELYKDYLAQETALRKELKDYSPEQLMQLVKGEVS